MNRCRAVKIIQAVHLQREIRLRQDPAAAQTADAINFGQTAGDYELRSEMKRCSRRVLVNCIQINFIDEHKRADAPRNITDFSQDRVLALARSSDYEDS